MLIVARCSERSFMSAPSTAGRSSVPGLKRDFLCQSRHPVMADVSCTRHAPCQSNVASAGFQVVGSRWLTITCTSR